MFTPLFQHLGGWKLPCVFSPPSNTSKIILESILVLKVERKIMFNTLYVVCLIDFGNI